MALIIKAYNPSRCGDCDLCELYTDMMTEESCYKCVVTTNMVDTEKKHYTCPIIGEIPDKHGDLKDVSILLHYLSHMHGATEHDNDLLREFEKMIKECPTVVEATE